MRAADPHRAVTSTRLRGGPTAARSCVAVLIVTLAWGAFAFGAVYPWAYQALLVCIVASAALGLIAARDGRRVMPGREVQLTLALVGAGVLGQLVPVPVTLLHAISPATDATLRQLQLPYAAGLEQFHPLSIAPDATGLGLTLFAALVILLFALVNIFSIKGVASAANGIVVIGVLLAIFAIVQKPLYDGYIYGFWQPLADQAVPFGPFVNKNHFAGWMLMALPIGVASLLAAIAERRRVRHTTLREHLVWLGSERGSRALATGLAVIVMGLSLVMTMSRSGISAFVASIIMSGWVFSRGFSSRAQKSLLVGFLAILIVFAIGWAGTDVLAMRFAGLNAHEVSLRTAAWADAIRITRAFPWTGTGLNTYGIATLLYQTADPTYHFMEAHNDYLQLTAEGGLLLAIPVAIALGSFVREVIRRADDAASHASWWIRRGAIMGLVSIALQETVDFSLQMPGNAVLFTVLAAIAIHRTPRS
jgi:hypothetical protein